MENEFKVEEDKNNFEIYSNKDIDDGNNENNENEKEKNKNENKNESNELPYKVINFVNASGFDEKIRIYDSQIINKKFMNSIQSDEKEINKKKFMHSIQSDDKEINKKKLMNMGNIGNNYINENKINNKENESNKNENKNKTDFEIKNNEDNNKEDINIRNDNNNNNEIKNNIHDSNQDLNQIEKSNNDIKQNIEEINEYNINDNKDEKKIDIMKESQRQIEKEEEFLDSLLDDNKENIQNKNKKRKEEIYNINEIQKVDKETLESQIKEKIIKEIIQEKENKTPGNEIITPRNDEKEKISFNQKQLLNINDNLMEIPIKKEVAKDENFDHDFVDIVKEDEEIKYPETHLKTNEKISKENSNQNTIINETNNEKELNSTNSNLTNNKSAIESHFINNNFSITDDDINYPTFTFNNKDNMINSKKIKNQKDENLENKKYENEENKKEEIQEESKKGDDDIKYPSFNFNDNNKLIHNQENKYVKKKDDEKNIKKDKNDDDEIHYSKFSYNENNKNIHQQKEEKKEEKEKEEETKKDDDDDDIKYPTFNFKEKKDNINIQEKKETKKDDDDDIKYPIFNFKEKKDNINIQEKKEEKKEKEEKEEETKKDDDDDIKYPTFNLKEKKEEKIIKGSIDEIKYPDIQKIEISKNKYINNINKIIQKNENSNINNNKINEIEKSNISNKLEENNKKKEIEEINNDEKDNKKEENKLIQDEQEQKIKIKNKEEKKLKENDSIEKQNLDFQKKISEEYEIHNKSELMYINIENDYVKQSEDNSKDKNKINNPPKEKNEIYSNNQIIENPGMKLSSFDAEDVIQDSNIQNKIRKSSNDFIEIRSSEINEPIKNKKNINNLNFTDNSIINLFDKILKKNDDYLKDKEFFIIKEKENIKDYIGSHKLYEIIFINKLGDKEFKCLRRYDNFDKLNKKLKIKYPYVVIPKLTPKNPYIKIMTYDEQFYNDRRLQLEFYLNFIYNQEIIKDTKEFFKFINDANFDENFFQKIEKNIPNFSSSTSEKIKNKFFTVFNYLGNNPKGRKLNDSEILIKKMSIHYKNIIKKYEEIKIAICDYINSIKNEEDNHKDLSDLLFYLKDSFENVENSKENLTKKSKYAKKISIANKNNYKLSLKLKNKLEALISLIIGICSSLDNYITFIEKYNEVTETLNAAKNGKWDNLNTIIQEYDVCEIMKNNYESVLLSETNNYVEMFDNTTNICLKEFNDILVEINKEILSEEFIDEEGKNNDF